MDSPHHHPPRIMLAAGEASGDMYAAELLPRLTERLPGLTTFGLGGAQSRAAGMDTIVDLNQVSVMGLVEVLRHYGRLRAALDELIAALEQRRPDLLIVIDFQEFNQRLAKAAKARGIPVLFFVAPQVWAWRASRAKHFDRFADHLAVLFDFEQPLFESHGLPTTHVGHPLIDLIDRQTPTRDSARASLALPADGPVIGLLPGSRHSEIARLLPIFLATAERLLACAPDRRFVLPCAESIERGWLMEHVDAAGPSAALRDQLTVTAGAARAVMAASDALLVASGTASLEAALIGTPMTIAYRSSPLTYAIASRLVQIKHIGLPNVILGREVVPERLQNAATPERLARDIEELLSRDSNAAASQRAAFRDVRGRLGTAGALDRLADLAADMVSE
ncbi:lipid-A-disaccharide synthase [Guyparkeria sp. 1SP6A2]|nr:lipid-A-disaccharide synthase [Guyparkeria sp. 1SP6A2]